MIETQAQKLVIDAVLAAGGMAHKMSNRFLVGVPDLLIKLPRYPAMLMEAKHLKIGERTAVPSFSFVPDVTMPQWKFLSDYYSAGMSCGVISFVEVGKKGIRDMRMAVFTLDSKSDWRYCKGDHVLLQWHASLANPATRQALIIELLEQVHVE